MSGCKLLLGLSFFVSSCVWAGFFDFLTVPKSEYELKGMPFYSQKGTNWCWVAVSQMAIQYKKSLRVPQCKLVSDATKQACCIGSLTCDHPGNIKSVVPNYGLDSTEVSPSLTNVDAALRAGKVPIMRLFFKDTGVYHFAIVQAKYEKNRGYRIYDPYYGVTSESVKSMQKRYLYQRSQWVNLHIVN